MSIRIAGQTDVTPVNNPVAVAPKSIEADAKTAGYTAAVQTSGADRADLSNASQLVMLAKNMTPSGKTEKLQALAARVGAGTYKPASAAVSRAIVQGLFKK